MNLVNRHKLMAMVFAVSSLCNSTLLGGLDNIWYTYQVFCTKKDVSHKTEAETSATQASSTSSSSTSTSSASAIRESAIEESQTIASSEVKQPETSRHITAPHGQLSPIHGAVAVEMGIIRHIYDIATRFDLQEANKIARAKAEEEIAKRTKTSTEQQESAEHKEEKEEKGAAQPADVQQPAAVQRMVNTILHQLIARRIGLPTAKGDSESSTDKIKQPDDMAIVRLVHTIFHRQNPTLWNTVDFVITDQLKNCTKDTIAEFVGILLATIEQGRYKSLEKGQPLSLVGWPKAQFSLNTINTWINDLDKTNVKEESKNRACAQLTTKIEKDDAIEDLVNHSKLTLQNAVNYAIEALKPACLEKSPFPPETVYLVLLGLLYQHTDLDKASLKTYYTALANRFGTLNSILVSFNKNVLSPKDLVFPKTAKDIKLLKNNILHASKQYKGVTDSTISFIHQNYEEIVFLSLLSGILPPSCRYDNSNLSTFDASTNTFKRIGISFADCMETTMRNLCNVLAYSTKEKLFSVKTISERQQNLKDEQAENLTEEETKEAKPQSSPTKRSLNTVLEAFYRQHPSPHETGADDANTKTYPHSDWSAVISNIPYVAYAHTTTSNVGQDWPGYIKIPTADITANAALAKFIKDNKYVIAQDDAILYEIQPSIRNIIIALDYLLNLNLFDGKLATTFADPAFIKTYVPKLCQALNLDLDTKQSSGLDAIDKQDIDGSKNIIVMGTSNTSAQFRITVDKGHGEFTSLEAKGGLKLPILADALVKNNLLPSSALFFHKDSLPTICNLKNPKSMYLSLFATELDNPDTAGHFRESTCLLISEDILKLLLYCVDRHPDPRQRVANQFDLYYTYCQEKPIDTILTEEMYKQMLSFIVSNYNNPDNASQVLLKKLCDSKKYNEVLVTFLHKLFSPKELPETNDINTRFVLDLFTWNMPDNKEPTKMEIAKIIYHHVITTITRALISKEAPTIQKALILLNALVAYPEYEQVCLKAVPLLSLELDYQHAPIILEYPNLLNFFIKNHTQFPTEFQQLILALIKTWDTFYNPMLFSQKKLLDATTAAINTFDPASAETIIEVALSHPQKQLSTYNFWDQVQPSYLNAIRFLQKLVEYGYQEHYKAVMKFGLQGMNASNIYFIMASLDILIALVAQKGGSPEEYEKIIENLGHLFKHAPELADKEVTLRSALIEQGYGIKEAIEAAIEKLTKGFSEQEAMADAETQARLIAKRLMLFESLLKNKQGHDEAIKTAYELWQKEAPHYLSTPFDVQVQWDLMFKREAIALLQLLLTYSKRTEDVSTFAITAITAANKELKSLTTSQWTSSNQWTSKNDFLKQKNSNDLAMTLLITMVQKEHGKNAGYQSILNVLPGLLTHEISQKTINLCAELLKQGFGGEIIFKIASDRITKLNKDYLNSRALDLKPIREASRELLEHSTEEKYSTNLNAIKKLMTDNLLLFNLLITHNLYVAEIIKFATDLWQIPTSTEGFDDQDTPAFILTRKAEAIAIFEQLFLYGQGIDKAIQITKEDSDQINKCFDLIYANKISATTDLQRKIFGTDILTYLIWYEAREKLPILLRLFDTNASRLLEMAQKAQAAQKETVKATSSSSSIASTTSTTASSSSTSSSYQTSTSSSSFTASSNLETKEAKE